MAVALEDLMYSKEPDGRSWSRRLPFDFVQITDAGGLGVYYI